MPFRNARTSHAFILKSSAKRSIRVLIRNRFFALKTGRERMFSFGKEGAGIWLTTKSLIDTSVFRRKDLSGVGRYHQMLPRRHARAIPPMGGVGEVWSVTVMIADRQFCMIAAVVPDPFVWTGRALQAESSEWVVWSCASVSGPCVELIAPGHHGYPRAFDLILGSASKASWVTRSRTRRRDRSPFFKSNSQTSAGISFNVL